MKQQSLSTSTLSNYSLSTHHLGEHIELRFSERGHFSLKLDLGSGLILQKEDHLHGGERGDGG